MQLRMLVTLLIVIGILMIMPLLMLGGVRQKVMCLVRSQMFLLFVLLVVRLFQYRRGRLICRVRGLTVNSHETLLSCRRPCHPRPAHCRIAFRAREVERHLMDLDPNGGADPSGCFPELFQKTAFILAAKLSRIFRRLLYCGEFLLEWRIADVTPIQPLAIVHRPLSIILDKFCPRFSKG